MSTARQGRSARWWHLLLAALLVLLSLPVFAALLLLARLWAGPLDVTGGVRRLAAHAAPELSVGRVRLTWNGWRQGPAAPLGLLVDDARLGVRHGGGSGPMRVARASASLDVLALLHGRVVFVAMSADDAAIALYRGRDGTVSLWSPGQGRDGAPTPGRGAAAAAPGRLDLDQLATLRLRRSTVTLHDVASGQSCDLDISELQLQTLRRPAAIGLAGRVAASLSCGGQSAPRLSLTGEAREDPQGAIVWHMRTDPAIPAAFARMAPTLAPLAMLDLPVRLACDLTLSGGFGRLMLPRTVDLTARLGAGTIRTLRSGSAPDAGLAIREGHLHLVLSLPSDADGPTRAVLSDAALVAAGTSDAPVLRLTGSLSRSGDRISAGLQAGIARFDFAQLQRLWPEGLAHGARRWITGNIVGGTGRDLAVELGLNSDRGWDGLHLAALSGGFDASDLTLYWLRPILPLREMDAHLVLEGPDSLRIESRHAVEQAPRPGGGSLAVGPSVMRITGLSGHDQLAHLDTHLHGALPDLLALLSHPRLRLLSRHPLGFTDPAGRFDGRLGLSIPLTDSVAAEQIPIHADVSLTDLHLGRIAAGRDLDHAAAELHAGNDGLTLSATGEVGGLPSSLSYGMDFRAGPPDQSVETAHLSARIDEAALRREGLQVVLDRFTGAALLEIGYQHRRDGAARVALALDLTGAALRTAFWSKPAGQAAQASGTLGLQDGRLASIEALHASGPGLLLDGRAELDAGHASTVVLERFQVGRSSGAGRIELPRDTRPAHVVLSGSTLDIAPILQAASDPAGAKGSGPAAATPRAGAGDGMAWRADLDFRRVLLGADRALSGVVLHAAAKGARLGDASLLVDGPTTVTATLSPGGRGRDLRLDAQDAGALLRAFGIGRPSYPDIEGGTLALRGRMEDGPAGQSVTGSARVGRFTVNDAPLAARLARDLSIYGFLTGAAGRQLTVTHFEVPFSLRGGMLRLADAHASNDALGATLRGSIDLRRSMLDLRGTIVPSYLFNALPGKLPGVGRVFSPETGGGLLAATVAISGPFGQPAIRVNPLALLAPGILRRLLFN